MPLELGMDGRRQMMLDEIRQQSHEIGAAAFFWHVVGTGTRFSGRQPPEIPQPWQPAAGLAGQRLEIVSNPH